MNNQLAQVDSQIPAIRRAGSRPIIRPVRGPEELEQLFRFRYTVYVEEMNRMQKHADHARKRIRDPLDEFAANLVAWDEAGSIVGAVRVNSAREGDLGAYEQFYDMRSAGDAHPWSTSITTRLMIAPKYRHSQLAVRLTTAAYETGLTRGDKFNFIDCNEHLIPFFTGLGFIQHIPRRRHEEYGLVACMRLSLLDRDHLQAIRSPFLATLDRLQSRPGREPAVINAPGAALAAEGVCP
jgi:predicted GNAT family N-acyltransferase